MPKADCRAFVPDAETKQYRPGVSQSGACGSRATQTGSPKGEAGGSERIKRPTKSDWLFFRSQQREQDHIADGFRAGKQHGEPVHSETEAAGRRHAVLKRQQKFLVDLLFFFACLFEQTLTLDN